MIIIPYRLNAVIAGFKKTSKIAQSVIVEDETKGEELQKNLKMHQSFVIFR